MVGDGWPVYTIAEIGINHNGSLQNALDMIKRAKSAGCDAVKFQKRTVDVVYAAEELARPRDSPFGKTNGDLKRGLEFGGWNYERIAESCAIHDVDFSASCWDEGSVNFIDQFDPPFFKVASPSLTDFGLLECIRSKGKPIVMSTGMSADWQIEEAVKRIGTHDLVLLHCVSAYPTLPEDVHLNFITTLQDRFGVPVGYSGHEMGTDISVAAVALGACMLERHVTMDPCDWGSDQSASITFGEMERVVAGAEDVRRARGTGFSKPVRSCEEAAQAKLRRVDDTAGDEEACPW